MNDRYLFRAKRIDNGEWAEGYYSLIGNKHVIISKESEGYYTESIEERHGYEIVNVDPLTACQCTGLIDKNGKLIWENDICIITDGTLDEEDGYFRLDWEIDRAMFEFEGTGICANFDNVSGYDCEVVGNIFDNPELLEVEE